MTLARMLFEILPPIGNTHGPLYMESLLRTVHRSLKRRSMSLQVASSQGRAVLQVDVPNDLRTFFLNELQDSYPGTIVQRVESSHCQQGDRTWKRRLRLRPDVLSIRTYDEFIDLADDRQFGDPVAGLLAIVQTGKSGRIACQTELTIHAAGHRRIHRAERIARRFDRGFASPRLKRWYLLAASSRRLVIRLLAVALAQFSRSEPDGANEGSPKPGDQLFSCDLSILVTAPRDAAALADARLEKIASAYGRFCNGQTFFQALKRFGKQSGFLLTPKEVATLWHPLTVSGDTVSRVQRPEFRELEPPVGLISRKGRTDETVLGRYRFRQQQTQFGISTDDLRRHMLVVGKTGCGKSTFLLNVVRQQVNANRGVVLIDPHGQLADNVLSAVPKRRTNDIIFFDVADTVAPVSFNPMVGPDGADPHLVADGVVTAFKNVFGFDEGSAPRLLHIFRNSLLTLIDTPHASLSNVARLLVDTHFRKSIVASVQNVSVRDFWLTEFNRWHERDRVQYVASLQNKLGAFLTNERLQAILSANRKGILLREIMDQSKVLICNLSKGRVGHDASKLLGSLLLSSQHTAAMSRADVAENDRPDCTIVVDEFHSYLADGNETMADALAESRKYRTSYVLSTQMLEQLDPATLAGVLGNCGSTLCMTIGPRDAQVLVDLLANGLTTDDLMKIPKYHAYIRLLTDGVPHTFSMKTLPPKRNIGTQHSDTLRRISRQRYGNKTAEQSISTERADC